MVAGKGDRIKEINIPDMPYLFLLGRVLLGGYFLHAGYTHFKNLKGMAGYAGSMGVPMPEVAVAGTGLLLTLGGLSILTGLYPAAGLTCLIIFFLGVTPKMHQFWKMQGDMKMTQKLLFMRNVALTGAILMLYSFPTPWMFTL
jgi:uncharacterized membrane protein YphA (DoxX/SURF4 family)